MDNNNFKKLSTLSGTLFIPLSVRANETVSPTAVIKDQKAVEIMGKANTADIITDGGSISTLGILARTTVIDDEIQKLLSGTPNAIIINLGAGLDTRISRLDNGSLRWYDLDFSEVIALRRQYFSENERIKFIEKSALDCSWVQDIAYSKDDTVIIIAEELIMTELETMRARHAVRSQAPKLRSSTIIHGLKEEIERCNRLGHLHFQLVTENKNAFKSFIPLFGRFENVKITRKRKLFMGLTRGELLLYCLRQSIRSCSRK